VNDRSFWIKPTYGNENLLWALDSTMSLQKRQALVRSKEEFIDSGYTIVDGVLEKAGSKWSYSGYSMDSQRFRSYVFVYAMSGGGPSLYVGLLSLTNSFLAVFFPVPS